MDTRCRCEMTMADNIYCKTFTPRTVTRRMAKKRSKPNFHQDWNYGRFGALNLHEVSRGIKLQLQRQEAQARIHCNMPVRRPDF